MNDNDSATPVAAPTAQPDEADRIGELLAEQAGLRAKLDLAELRGKQLTEELGEARKALAAAEAVFDQQRRAAEAATAALDQAGRALQAAEDRANTSAKQAEAAEARAKAAESQVQGERQTVGVKDAELARLKATQEAERKAAGLAAAEAWENYRDRNRLIVKQMLELDELRRQNLAGSAEIAALTTAGNACRAETARLAAELDRRGPAGSLAAVTTALGDLFR
ncbi:MAG: hypothetical protein GC191_19050 [Azospirillum sp.]|nr:hypothetical protein [Azospirillum sp.]